MEQFFIFDTNTLISALILPNSIPRKALYKAQNVGILVFSEATFAELSEVIHRSKFDKYIPLNDRLLFLFNIKETSLFFETIHVVTACRDAKDNMILELALSSSADIIVSGDKDLLELNPYQNIKILTPAAYLEELT